MSGRNSTSPPPPPSPQSNATAPASPTPPPPQTNATASPPPTTPTNDASPPPPLINSASPTESPPPPPRVESTSPPGSGGMPTTATVGIIVGVGIGAFCMLLAVGVIFLFYRRRKRRRARTQESGDYPPEPKNDQFNQHFQQNYAPPLAGKLMFPKPTPPPPPGLSSTSTSLGSEKPPSGPSPGIAYGLSQISFTYEELLMATNGFSDANLLGQGGFGYVHKGVLPNGKVVAIKHLKAGSGQGEREFQAEIEVISRVHHRHLVSLVGYCSSGVQRMLIYEFVSNDTLEFHLHGKGRPTMDWQTRLKIALGSAKGLAYLHEDCQPKIIHRDIKAANILLDDSFEAKVADFGLAKFSSDLDTHVSTRVMGTFGYLAPEYASSGKLTEKSDVFSFGVVLLELITGRRPVDRTESFADDSMVEWARPLLAQALETGNSSALVDTRLQNDYNASEMACVLACAAACVRHSGKRRPRMSQVVRALEGNLSPEELNEGVIPGHSTVFSLNSYGSTEYSTSEYKADMMKFRKLALESEEQEQGTSETSGPSSEFGVHQSASSGEGQQSTQEFGRTKKEA